MENLIATLFLAREIAHREHLRTRSLSVHMALGSFYEGIVGHADAIAEAFQGRFDGVLGEIPMLVNTVNGTIVEVLQSHVEWIAANRYQAVDQAETAIHNRIDEAVALYLDTLYKLRRLG
jgi:hypothetical protein